MKHHRRRRRRRRRSLFANVEKKVTMAGCQYRLTKIATADNAHCALTNLSHSIIK